MICDLPLLFRNGFPTCLENLTVGQLEKFVPFMIKCSGVPPQIKPKWWPDELYPSKLTKISGMSDKNWLSYLKRLVLHCYSYHGCEYALKLCTDLSHKCHSMKRTSECGVENSSSQVYKVPRGMPATRRSTKSRCNLEYNRDSRSTKNALKRIADNGHERNKSPEQIYLCDYCDSEFRVSNEIRAHEKLCTEKNISKAPLPGYIRKKNQNRYTLRNNNEPNMQNITSMARSGPGVPSNVDSISSVTIKSLLETHSKPREPCKSCGNLFVSTKLLSDHESICLKQQLLLARFLSTSSNTIPSSKKDKREQLSSRHNLSSTNTFPEADSTPLRKKRMKLLPREAGQSNFKDVSQNEIFLCDKCDQEFTSFTDIQRHEATGCGMMRELTPSPVSEGAHELPAEENFMRYFELTPSCQSQSTFRPIARSTFRSKRFLGNPMRYSAIPISSPLGSLIHGTQIPTSSILTKIEKVERYCSANPTSTFGLEETNAAPEWRISWKEQTKNVIHEIAHSYIYPSKRWWKMPELWNTQMKIKQRNSELMARCKSVQIRLWKMTTRDIELYTACRTVRPIVKKLTNEEIRLFTNL
ncbi:hypothetical protein R5R35_002721 [Gryllus longicercus]